MTQRRANYLNETPNKLMRRRDRREASPAFGNQFQEVVILVLISVFMCVLFLKPGSKTRPADTLMSYTGHMT